MRNRLLAAIAIALMTVSVTAVGIAYTTSQTSTADATPLSPGGAWAIAPQVMPLLSYPKPAVVATPTPEPPDRADARVKAEKKAKPAAKKASGGSDDAQRILRGLIRKYPILKGVTVTYGKTRSGAQAEAYYKSGRIIVSPNHRASLSRILTHEVWHIIDWRDNGRIDWGERVPR